MSLFWRATFIDYNPLSDDQPLPRRRSTSTPAGSRKDVYFDSEQTYVRNLAKKVGLAQEVTRSSESKAKLPAGMSRSVNTLPLLDEVVSNLAENYEEDDFDPLADHFSVTDAVQSLSSLPMWRSCGTAAPTMDSLCTLDDIPITQACGLAATTMDSLCPLNDTAEDTLDDCCEDEPHHANSQCIESGLQHGDNLAVAKPATAPQSITVRNQGETGNACLAPPQHAETANSDPLCSFPCALHKDGESGPTKWTRSEPDIEQRSWSAVEPNGTTTSIPVATQGLVNVQASFTLGDASMRSSSVESSLPATQELSPGSASFECAGHSMRCSIPESPLGQVQISSSKRGCAMEDPLKQEYREEDVSGPGAGGQHRAPSMPVALQTSVAVSVAIDHGVVMLVFRQSILTLEDVLAISQAVQTCIQNSNSVSVVFVWAEGAPVCQSAFELHRCYAAMQEQVASLKQSFDSLPHPVLGFASGSQCASATMLLAGCDQVISTSSAVFSRVQDGELRFATAKAAQEQGSVGELVENSAGLLQVCAAVRRQVLMCSKEELRCMKQSLQGMRNYLTGEVQSKAPQPLPADSAAQSSQKTGSQECAPDSQSMDANEMEGGSSEGVTSLMLCNLPCRLTQEQLVDIIESMGFGGKVDHMHFPTSKGSPNLGYVFLNLVSPEDAAAFTTAFRNYRFVNFHSRKVAEVKPARIQGRASMVAETKRRSRRARGAGLGSQGPEAEAP